MHITVNTEHLQRQFGKEGEETEEKGRGGEAWGGERGPTDMGGDYQGAWGTVNCSLSEKKLSE